jgi:hypothetical protein
MKTQPSIASRKGLSMITEAETFQRRTRRQDACHKAFTRPNYLGRFRYFIEKSDWDDVIVARGERISRMCIGLIIVATLYNISLVLTILFLG